MLLGRRVMDRKILALEATRDLTKVWAHVDMDAFYAAAEELANPSLVSARVFLTSFACQTHVSVICSPVLLVVK